MTYFVLIFSCGFLSVLRVHDLRMNETTFCPNLLNEVSYNICLLFKSQLISCISQFLHLYKLLCRGVSYKRSGFIMRVSGANMARITIYG